MKKSKSHCCGCNSHLTRNRKLLHRQSVFIGIFMGFAIAVSALCAILPAFLYPSRAARHRLDDTLTGAYLSETSRGSSRSATTSTFLFDEVRILCMVFTFEDNFASKARLVSETWGKRCNKLLFFANTTDSEGLIDVTVLNITESRAELWGKTKAAFQVAYDEYLDQFDWFLKADDDTYVILENLRHFLYPFPADFPLYFGYKFKLEYMSGGAGYVLSKESVRKLIEEALPDEANCMAGSFGEEDYEMGRCLRSVNVSLGNSRDALGKERFSPLPPNFLLNPDQNKTFWYYTTSYYQERAGLDCCSDSAISFHYVYNVDFYVLEYFIYHLKPINRLFLQKLPRKYSEQETEQVIRESTAIELPLP